MKDSRKTKQGQELDFSSSLILENIRPYFDFDYVGFKNPIGIYTDNVPKHQKGKTFIKYLIKVSEGSDIYLLKLKKWYRSTEGSRFECLTYGSLVYLKSGDCVTILRGGKIIEGFESFEDLRGVSLEYQESLKNK